jgi:hypothetical protein
VVDTIAKAIHLHGLDSEVYHCPLNPQHVDLVVIPALKVAVLKEIPGLNFRPQDVATINEIKIYNLNHYLQAETLDQYQKHISNGQQRFWAAIDLALKNIAAAKAEHDVLESYYVPAMDFGAINDKRAEVLGKILSRSSLKTRG